jgi:hypothetical protein
MRFIVEERHLTDASGRPIPAPGEVAFHHVDAETIDGAVGAYVAIDSAEIIGSVLKFPGFQAVATIRKGSGVYTLQFTPTSQQHIVP